MKAFTNERQPETNDEVWILEHESVYTYGVSTDPKKMPADLSHPILRSDRGGKITYHGPGQMVVYILMDFNRASMKPKEFIAKFQSAIYKTVKNYCKDAVLNEDEDGIFLDNLKLASFGLKITKKGSYHGAAINHSMNLDAWNEIVICGNPDHRAIDIRSLGISVSRAEMVEEIEKKLLLEF